MKSLPNYVQFEMFEPTHSKKLFTAAGDDTISLLDSMLQYDPNKRPKASAALQHEYFRNLPRPTRPNKLPRDVGDSDDKKRKFEDDEIEGASNIKRRLF